MNGKLRNMTGIYLLKGDKILLLYRQGGKVVNNVWTASAGGHFEKDELNDATAAGRGYGVAGGVASAIEECIREYYPDIEVNIEHAESLTECKKMLMLAKAGKKNGCLIEGMACPGGCIAGAGTNIAIPQAMKEVAGFKAAADIKIPPK